MLLVLKLLSTYGPGFSQWPLPLRALGSTMIVVPIVVNITAPLFEAVVAKLMRLWLHCRRSRARRQ
ncbi:hypothetical protein ABE493_16620 [Stenotrophomonas terrae]|uniref:hypothetical protein n=1 Tax=Stenotrophomonas terrae TaxID=405446 RepID=UPI003208EB42